MSLLCFEDISNMLPVILMPVVIIVIFAVVIAAAVKRSKAEQQRRQEMENRSNYPFTDGNGRTQHQRDYLNGKRRELSERKAASSDTHGHLGGKVENYGKIVGSLGEVNDEGCDELDGIRLIEHDEAYCDDPDHILSSDPTELERAIVLGEVLNNPRFKQPYHRK